MKIDSCSTCKENSVAQGKLHYAPPTFIVYGKVEEITQGTNKKSGNIDSANYTCGENQNSACYS